MSGGSMNYIGERLLAEASFRLTTPERHAFNAHLQLVAAALHAIEWVDSGDWGEGRESDAIRAVLREGAPLESAILLAEAARSSLQAEIERAVFKTERVAGD